MHALPDALAPMAAYRQFIIWQAVWDAGKNKYQKKPINPQTGIPHNPHDPAIWLDAETAVGTAQLFGDGYGTGFVFTKNDPFWFLDIDNCYADGQWSELAQQLLSFFPGAAVEVSFSGTGLHIFGSGSVPEHGCKNTSLDLEFYDSERFVALTGNSATGNALTDHTQSLSQVVPFYFPVGQRAASEDWTSEPVADWNGPEDDAELIEKMLSSRGSANSVFGASACVADLWNCDVDKLSQAYPDGFGDRAFDHSSADAALCQHLAFWTGKDCERMDRLFRQSGLYREKWERPDYREGTVLKASGMCNAVYSTKKRDDKPSYTQADSVTPAPTTITATTSATYREGLQYLAPSSQEELFAGCVYIRDVHRAYTPDGALLKPEQFKATYGGYIFALDSTNDKTTKNAWEAFTESQGMRFPRAHSTCFRPELAPGSMITEADRVLVNCYVPVEIPSVAGDVQPFLNHLQLILPNESDRQILLAYMAACVQYKGVKFQWSPMIQGCEGNGKTLIIKCVEAAVGQRYTHLPNASDLGGNGAKFNSWLQNKLFIGVEEIYVSDRREVSDALKPLITNDRIEFQAKGSDQVTGDSRANFIMCSNHTDAILKTRGDRRYCVFYTAQQTPEDLYRAGMTLQDGVTPTTYFPELYGWLKSGGYAIVTNYLENYQIPDQLNPATLCSRAPVTSSTEEAILQSLGGVEQEIIEAIEQGLPGFAGGWVSSLALDRLLKARRDDKRIPHSKRRGLMAELGYVLHPGLPTGRVNTVVQIDAGKPRLYVKRDTIQANMVGAKQITDAYVKAQGVASGPAGESAEVFSK